MGLANSLTPMSPEYWSKIMGRKVYKATVYKNIASSEEQATLQNGQQVNRPYRSNVVVESYTKGTAATAQDLTATDDLLTINQQKTILMYIDDVDKVQNKWDAARVWAEEAGRRLAIAIDARFLYEVVNAANTIDAGDLGGSAGTAVALTTSNVAGLFGKFNRKLDIQNVDVERAKRHMVISPQFYDILWQFVAGKESILGDKTSEFGSIGRYAGVELYMSNNLTASAVATPAACPTANDTITIAGVTFTFVDTIGTTAGNVLANSGTVAQVITRLTTLINAPGTTTANGVAFTGADLRTVQTLVAVDGTTIITVYQQGGSFLTVTSSAANIVWSKKTQHVMGGVDGSIDVVTQLEPDVQMASTVPNGKRGMNVMPLTIFGVKTFDQGTRQIVDIKIDSSAF